MTEQSAPDKPAPRPTPSVGAHGLDAGLDWERVSPRYIVVDVVGSVLLALVGVAIAVPFAVLDISWGFLPVAAIPLLVFTLPSVLSALVAPRRNRAIGYALRDDDLLFRTGLLFQRLVAVPYGRMQLIDINRGPVARRLGLAELKFVTAAAATGVTVPGLREERATELRDRLIELAESRRVGL